MTMMMNRAMQLQAALMSSQTVKVKIGVVTSYDPNRYQAKVELQPEGLLTGWLPISSQWAGASWGCFMPPSIDQHVRVEFLDGHIDAGVITGMLFSNAFPPVAVPAGEMLMQHKSGSLLHFDNAGKVTTTANTSMEFNAPAGFTFNGNSQFNGNVQASGTIADLNAQHGTVGDLRTAHNGHTHTGDSGGTTSTPSSTV